VRLSVPLKSALKPATPHGRDDVSEILIKIYLLHILFWKTTV